MNLFMNDRRKSLIKYKSGSQRFSHHMEEGTFFPNDQEKHESFSRFSLELSGSPISTEFSHKDRLSMLSSDHSEGLGLTNWIGRKTDDFRSPNDFVGKLKFYYDKYNLRHVAPMLILLLYSIFGAVLFYWVEHDNELELLDKEKSDLEMLREQVYRNFQNVMSNSDKSESERHDYITDKILTDYEQATLEVRIPKGLKWDMWGALFYTGTIFTTIGYGNINPRTNSGRALSIGYALVGIPLLLAILSNFGELLTVVFSRFWIAYLSWKDKLFNGSEGKPQSEQKASISFKFSTPVRKSSRAKKSQSIAKQQSLGSVALDIGSGLECLDEEGGKDDDEETVESKTIPIWLALFICVGWLCGCAGLFCLWETRWSYFTSFYFFFISLSTIGLGDIVPDHPRLMILNFWLVIIGLSLVGMLLSVIQIKIEEWLYQLMIRIQEEYQRALAMGESPEKEEILNKLLHQQPWLMRKMAPKLMTDKQTDRLDTQFETFERIVNVNTNKGTQTTVDHIDGIRPPADRPSWPSPTISVDSVPDRSEWISPVDWPPLSRGSSVQLLSVPEEPGFFSEEPRPTLEEMTRKNDVHKNDTESNELLFATASSSISIRSLPDVVNFDDKIIQTNGMVDLVDRSMQADDLEMLLRYLNTYSSNDEAIQTSPEVVDTKSWNPFQQAFKVVTRTTTNLVDKITETEPQMQKVQIDSCTETDKYVIIPPKQFLVQILKSVSTATEEMEQNEQILNMHRSNHDTQTNPTLRTVPLSDLREKSSQYDAIRLPSSMYCDFGTQTCIFYSSNSTQTDILKDDKKERRSFFPKMLRKSERCEKCALKEESTIDIAIQTVIPKLKLTTVSPFQTETFESTIEDDQLTKKREMITQTDDSYLKIARRLDEYRTNHTDSLSVVAFGPQFKKKTDWRRQSKNLKRQQKQQQQQQQQQKQWRKTSINHNSLPPSPEHNSSSLSPWMSRLVKTPVNVYRRASRSTSRMKHHEPTNVHIVDQGYTSSLPRDFDWDAAQGEPKRKRKMEIPEIASKTVSDAVALYEGGVRNPSVGVQNPDRKRKVDVV